MTEAEIIIPTYQQYVKAGQLRGDWQTLLRYIVEHERLIEERDALRLLLLQRGGYT